MAGESPNDRNDRVAVELLPQEQWHEENSLALADEGWMGTRINGLMLEIEEKQTKLIRKKKSRRSHSAPPFYQGKKKFFATSVFSRKAAGINNIKTVHDGSLMPETNAVRRLQHSAEAIYSEPPSGHPISVINLPPKLW